MNTTENRTLIRSGVFAGITPEFRGRRVGVYKEADGVRLYFEGMEPRSIAAEHLESVLVKIIDAGAKFHWGFVCNPLLPLAETFADLFEDGNDYTVAFCSPEGYSHRRVNVRPELRRFVEDCSGLFGGVCFEIVAQKGSPRAWVYMKAQQIIATRYVAQIEFASVQIP